MSRKQTFSETVSFQTTGTDDGGENTPNVFLENLELNQKPDPGQRVTLQTEIGCDQSIGSAWFEASIDGKVVSSFDGIDVEPDRPGSRSSIITAPDKDEFTVEIVGGYEE